MLYPKSKRSFDNSLFQSPTSEYRCAPFWAWNKKLDWNDMEKQIEVFNEMGMGGFHIHSRIGLNTPYLSAEFMDHVKKCNRKAKELNMLTWLYDEDKWPSGFGGGIVTKNHEFRSRYILFSPFFHENGYYERGIPQENRLGIDGELSFIAKYKIEIKDGYLHSYQRLEPDDGNDKDIWYAYRIVSKDLPWFNNQAYVDTLNKKAINKFIQTTHHRYLEALGDEFSRSVPAIFTDEPQFVMKQGLAHPYSRQEVGIPYTDHFEQSFQERFKCSFLDNLPEIFWELKSNNFSQVRYWYHEHIAELFASSFADTIGGWCKDHNIMLTGHMMAEATLESQTRALGETMRAYRSFDIPGIDILANRYEYSTAKQAQSAARQYGRPGVLSELYGVTNWDFDFRGHKLQGDWQAAMGVSVRVPHLSWMGMGGESKRDYPSPIDSHSPWYKKYHLIEDHFSRVNVCMTRGIPDVQIGVIHPVESYWLSWGPDSQTKQKRVRQQEGFDNLIDWLLFSNLDFDFISESSIPQLYKGSKNKYSKLGEMQYEVLIVPELITIRTSTVKMLNEHIENGGKVIFLGHLPQIMDGDVEQRFDNEAFKEYAINSTKHDLAEALEDYRQVDTLNKDNTRNENYIYQLRDEQDCKWLFIAPGKPVKSLTVPTKSECEVIVRGIYEVWLYDTMTGKQKHIPAFIDNGYTHLEQVAYEHDSFLYRLVKKSEPHSPSGTVTSLVKPACSFTKHLSQPCEYKLSEKNVLLLDMAGFQIDSGTIYDREEILKIDDTLRRKLNYPLRTDSFPQPWLTASENTFEHTVELRFEIESEMDIEQAELAYEGEGVIIKFNNEIVDVKSDTFFVDKCFNVKKLGTIQKGINNLTLTFPFGPKTDLEWCYILGDFGTRVIGNRAIITKPNDKLCFSDITRQGLSFYGGNICYKLDVDLPESNIIIEIPQYKGALVEVMVDGERKGNIIFSPYRLDCGFVTSGKHSIEFILYGNRFNTFGQLHNTNRYEEYYGPNTWRTNNNFFSYEYQLRELGILAAPMIYACDP
ncbi:MAG TPA: glycosyl hydrolase [Thermoclostridium sp.]|nr:glycosyl hydrolase [Thermoclostridium sp.]